MNQKPNKKLGDGFGNHSSLMVHLLTLATCWFDSRQKQRFFIFSRYLQIEDALFICTVNYVLVQIYKCDSRVNPRQLIDAKLSMQFICIMNHVPFQMYNAAQQCCLFFDERCVIFLQPFKCASVVSKSDRPP